MAVVLLVLGGDRGRHQIRRDLGQRDVGAPARLRVEDLVEQVAIAVEDAGGLELGRAAAQVLDGGQTGGQRVVLVQAEGDDGDRRGDEQEERQDRHAQHAASAAAPA